MAVNFNNLNKAQTVKPSVDNQNQVKKDANDTAINNQQTKSVHKDSVSITSQARQLNAIEKKADNGPVMNQKKVDELKNAITSGEYKINPEKLAARIADFEFNLN